MEKSTCDHTAGRLVPIRGENSILYSPRQTEPRLLVRRSFLADISNFHRFKQELPIINERTGQHVRLRPCHRRAPLTRSAIRGPDRAAAPPTGGGSRAAGGAPRKPRVPARGPSNNPGLPVLRRRRRRGAPQEAGLPAADALRGAGPALGQGERGDRAREEAADGPGVDPRPMVRASRGGREALEQVARFCAGLQDWVDEEWTDVLNELGDEDRVGGVEDVERVVKILSRALDEMAGAREVMKMLETLHANERNPLKISSTNEFTDTWFPVFRPDVSTQS